jgi:drug/metabolite transporter (DMT)-like permease
MSNSDVPLFVAWIALCILYLAVVGTVVAFLLFYWLLRRMDVTKVLLVSLVTPVLALAVGAVSLGERLGAPAFFGTAMILVGVFLGLRGLPGRKGTKRL